MFIDKSAKYKAAEDLGRDAFTKLAKILFKNNEYTLHFEEDRYSTIDCVVTYNDTDNVERYIFVEIKVRYTEYDTYLLELKKAVEMQNLIHKRKYNKNQVTLLYVNFTPNSTFLFDVDTVMSECEQTVNRFNSHTVESRTDKVLKNVYMIPKNSGYEIKFKAI